MIYQFSLKKKKKRKYMKSGLSVLVNLKKHKKN